jgi:hypothetical protein
MPRALDAEERARLVAAQRLLKRVVAMPGAPDSIRALQKSGFSGCELDERDSAVLADVDYRALHVYRKLVRATLTRAISDQLTRTVARMGETAVDDYARRYFEQELPRSPILRDVAYEFAAWCAPAWKRDESLPPYLGDLARYELLEFDVYCALENSALENSAPEALPAAAEPSLEAHLGVAFDSSVRIARFDHAVHRLPDDADDRTLPEEEPTALLSYRDAEGDFRQMSLTPMASSILLSLWRDGGALGEAITAACTRHDEALDQRVIDGCSVVLADLAERGALRGPRQPGPLPPPSPFAHWLVGEAEARD